MKPMSLKLLLSAVLLSFLATSAFAAPKYQITDLGAGMIPSAINKNGDVVGTVITADGLPEAFIYQGGVVEKLGGKLAGMGGSWGMSINDSAQIAGTFCLDEPCSMRHGFMTKNGEIFDLMVAAGLAEGIKINNSGLVLGDDGADYHARQVILYDAVGNTTNTFGAQYNGSVYPQALNNLGQAVFTERFCADCGVYMYLFSGGTLQQLPQSVYVGEVTDINDRGQIVGNMGAESSDRGFIYDQDVIVLPDDMHGVHIAPEAINNEGVMVGNASATDLQLTTRKPMWHKPTELFSFQPAVFEKKKITLLQGELTKTEDQWTLDMVLDINDSGQIIGYGTKNGVIRHGFLLTPAHLKVTP